MLIQFGVCQHTGPEVPWPKTAVARAGAVPRPPAVVARPVWGTTVAACGEAVGCAATGRGRGGTACGWYHSRRAVVARVGVLPRAAAVVAHIVAAFLLGTTMVRSRSWDSDWLGIRHPLGVPFRTGSRSGV